MTLVPCSRPCVVPEIFSTWMKICQASWLRVRWKGSKAPLRKTSTWPGYARGDTLVFVSWKSWSIWTVIKNKDDSSEKIMPTHIWDKGAWSIFNPFLSSLIQSSVQLALHSSNYVSMEILPSGAGTSEPGGRGSSKILANMLTLFQSGPVLLVPCTDANKFGLASLV